MTDSAMNPGTEWDHADTVWKHKRKILIIEDNELNRDILETLLEDEYEIMTAPNGKIGLQLLADHYKELSAILLDVVMPVCNGYEFLEQVRGDSLLSSVPVIVTTGSDSTEDEERCLNMGASDFVMKPYNMTIVRARIRSIIKLKESEATLSAIEYDPVSGFYTMQAFCHHGQRFMQADPQAEYDMAVLDIREYKLLKSVLGDRECTRILEEISDWIRRIEPDMLAAREGDRFFLLGKHESRRSVQLLETQITTAIRKIGVTGLSIRSGIYKNVNTAESVSVLCDRALMAADSLKNQYTSCVAVYDEKISALRRKRQKMEADFDRAIHDGEFQVWYQPKVDIGTEQIVAAEALVRWIDYEGKMISPGEFIPLFETDGLIYRLDEYVFRQVCDMLKKRIKNGKCVVPISVNLSRNSIFHQGMIDVYARNMHDCQLAFDMIPLELTESAAAGGRIPELMHEIVSCGFSVHMDDFGSGYSSLSSLGELPVDVIKLDKSLCDQIGSHKGDIILKHIIGIATDLGMKIVAEGVEKKEQVAFLREAGCHMIQGYYYSPPRQREVFEDMIDKGGWLMKG